MSQGNEDAGIFSTLMQDVFSLHLLMINHGDKKVGSGKQQRAVELGRRHANHGERSRIQLNFPPHHSAVALKMLLPIRIAQHNVGSAVGSMLVCGAKETAKIWLNAQYVKVVPACLNAPRTGHVLPRIHSS